MATTRSRTSGQSVSGMYAREAALHFCPWYSYAPRTIATASASTSALGVGDDEVLAAGLAHDSGVAGVALQVLADRAARGSGTPPSSR